MDEDSYSRLNMRFPPALWSSGRSAGFFLAKISVGSSHEKWGRIAWRTVASGGSFPHQERIGRWAVRPRPFKFDSGRLDGLGRQPEFSRRENVFGRSATGAGVPELPELGLGERHPFRTYRKPEYGDAASQGVVRLEPWTGTGAWLNCLAARDRDLSKNSLNSDG